MCLKTNSSGGVEEGLANEEAEGRSLRGEINVLDLFSEDIAPLAGSGFSPVKLCYLSKSFGSA